MKNSSNQKPSDYETKAYEVSLISSTHVDHDLECVLEKQFQDEYPTSTINVGMLAIDLVFLNTLKVHNEQ